MRADVSRVVERAARRIEAQAKRLAPVDTGFLRNSIQSAQIGDLTWSVAVGAEYGVYVEMGTRYMAAQPFFFPAVTQAERQFNEELRRLFK